MINQLINDLLFLFELSEIRLIISLLVAILIFTIIKR